VSIALFLSILLVAACGLVYELIAGTVASYLVGDSVFQFSTVIGTYLFAMGIGSFLSRFVRGNLARLFVRIEILIAVIGGFSSSALFVAFAFTQGFQLLLYMIVLVVGTLVGLEIPLLMRLVKDRYQFRDAVSHVLTFDYLGALFASVLFPLVLVPKLGLIRSGLFFGIVNAGVALWSTRLFAEQIVRPRRLQVACVAAIAVLSAAFAGGSRINAFAEDNIYADEIILSRDTPYQHIVLTRWKDDVRLFLNSHLQFSSRDEYRYHEALVHPGLASVPAPRRVLVLGGGDGLAVREILKYPEIERIVLVDLDPEMTRCSRPTRSSPVERSLAALAEGAGRQRRRVPLGRLGSRCLRLHRRRSSRPDELLAGQAVHHRLLRRAGAPSPRAGRSSCRARRRCSRASRSGASTKPSSRQAIGRFPTMPMCRRLASGGSSWPAATTYTPPTTLPAGLRFLAAATLPNLFEFPSDMARVSMPPTI
jgi:Predicted spermidine synthase with an N-terminal membrane domain